MSPFNRHKQDMKDESIDDLLDDDLFKEAEPSPSTAQNEGFADPSHPSEASRSDLPSVMGTVGEIPDDFKAVADRVLAMYASLPELDYDSLYEEISELNVGSEPTPTLQLINLKLQRVQASKDRLSSICEDVIRCHTFKKRAVNILSDSWNRFATGSSADKRKADSSYRMSEFQIDLAQLEALNNVCEHIGKNLDSQHNAISRQITIIQSQLKMFDMGRGALPDFDFNKSALNEGFESFDEPIKENKSENQSKQIDSSKPQEADECSF